MLLGVALAWTALSGGGAPGIAAAEEGERERMVRLVEEALSSPSARREAIEAGERRAVLCAYCHGKDGNSVKPDIPNLAAQNPAYLLQQIEKFVDGRRENFVMQTLAKEFTMEDKVNLAVYYASQEVAPQEVDPEAATRGKQIYQSVCQMCHGPDGKGKEGFARIAGQKMEYVKQTLKRYRENAHRRAEGRAATVRTDPRMERVTRSLTDDEVASLAAYLALLGND